MDHSLHFTSLTSLHSQLTWGSRTAFATDKDGSRRSAAKSERVSYPHGLVPSGFPDTAFASRVSPRALRALRPAGFHHTALTKERKRLVPTPAGALRLPRHDFSIASQRSRASRARPGLNNKNDKNVPKKVPKKASSPAKTEVFHEKKCLFLLEKTTQPRKKLKFFMKK